MASVWPYQSIRSVPDFGIDQGSDEARDALENGRINFQALVATVDEPLMHLALLLEKSSAMIGIYDPSDRIRAANAAFRETFFLAPDEAPTWEEMIRRNHAARRGTVLSTDDLEGWLRSVKSRRGKVAHRRFESDLMDGRWIMATETVLESGWIQFIGVDITQLRTSVLDLRQDRDEAVRASQTDDLTGVSNRRHVMAYLDDLLAGRTAYGQAAGCACLIDIDHFKQINDRYGHQAGDEVLICFARKLRDGIRAKDRLGRVGGEEFLLIFPETTLDQAQGILARMFDAVRNCGETPGLPGLTVTFSAGLTRHAPGETAGAVYRRCDLALYAAKAAGRNQMHINPGPA